MTDLTPVSSNDSVIQLENNTFALGGPGAPMNQQAQSLLNRQTFFQDSLSNTADPVKGAALVGYRGRTGRAKLDDFLSVKDFGAVGDGVTDDTAALQAAHASGINVIYPPGNYKISAPIPVLKGQNVIGSGGGRFTTSATRTSTLTCAAGGISGFTQVASVSPSQEDGLSVYDMIIVSDNPITLNNPTVLIADGGASPPLMRSKIHNVSFVPITPGVGTGLSMSKCFDFEIKGCDFGGHDIQLMMQGCDLGEVSLNRFANLKTYGILELGVSTFGSQVEIKHNDILLSAVGGTFIKTTGRHVRIFDNYLEQTSGSCAGFIDASSTGVPTFGANAVSTTRYASVEIEKNRIDGHSLATSFIYRFEPVGVTARINDTGTTGPLSTLSWLTVVGDELPLFFNTTNGCIYDFHGGTQINSKWNSFKTSALSQNARGVEFDVRSLLSLNNSELRRDNNHLKVTLTPSGFVLKPTLTTVFNCILPIVDGLNNKFLKSGVTYNVTVVARAKSGTPTLRIAKLVSLVVQGSVIDTVLSTQDSVIATTMTGALTTDTVGLGLRGVSASDDIEISSVSFQAI